MERAFKGIWIPADIWLNDELTLLEKVFLVEIDSLDNDNGCFASNDYFAKFFKLSKNRCSEVIKSLEKKGLVSISYIYKPDTKLIEKRVIKVFGKSNIGIRNSEEGIRNLDGGYSENCEDNNIYINNTINNISYSSKAQIEDVIAYYKREIAHTHILSSIEQQTLLKMSESVTCDLVIRAMEISIEANVKELRYIKGIIKKWLDANITTLEELEAYKLQNKFKTSKSITKNSKNMQSKNVFTQETLDALREKRDENGRIEGDTSKKTDEFEHTDPEILELMREIGVLPKM